MGGGGSGSGRVGVGGGGQDGYERRIEVFVETNSKKKFGGGGGGVSGGGRVGGVRMDVNEIEVFVKI